MPLSNPLKVLLERSKRSKANYQETFASLDNYVLNDLIKKYGFFDKTTFVQGDPSATAFNEGQRSVVISILTKLHKDPNKLIEEYNKNQQNIE